MSKDKSGLTSKPVGYLLGRAYFAYLGLTSRLLEESGLVQHCKPGMASLMLVLFDQEDQTLTEVSRKLGVAKSTMTGMVQQLLDAKLITAKQDPNDRRAMRLNLTALGRSLEPKCRRLAADIEAGLTRPLKPTAVNDLKRHLVALTEDVTAQIEQADAAKH